MGPIEVKRAVLVIPLMVAALLVLPSAAAWACSGASATPVQSLDRAPGSDTAWLVPLFAGLLLAVGLGVALVVVVRRGHRRE